MPRLLFSFGLLLTSTLPSQAHWGHLGDLAGHGHLLGLGAVVAAGALAGLIGILKDDEKQEEADPEEEGDAEGELA